jgi:hypothetical protein
MRGNGRKRKTIRRVNLSELRTGEEVIGLELHSDGRHRIARATESAVWVADVTFESRLDQAPPASAIDVPVVEQFWCLDRRPVFRVQPEIRHEVIDVAIVVEIAAVDAGPPSEQAIKPCLSARIRQAALLIAKKLHRPPLVAHQQIDPAIAIRIRPERAGDEPRFSEGGHFVGHITESTVPVLQ